MQQNNMPGDIHGYTKENWNQMAHFWIKNHGDHGNEYHQQLVSPTAEKLLDVQSGHDKILEIACGSGVFAKRLHELGAKSVVATDFSSEFLEEAKQKCKDLKNMDFFLLDATNEEAILNMFGLERFDKAVCNMGIMDMSSIEPLFNGLFKVLKPGGTFVFTILHPCFNGLDPVFGVEKVDDPYTFERTDVSYVKVTKYLNWEPCWGKGMPNQPMKQLYFHRPLHELFSVITKAGFVVDGFEEPLISEAKRNLGLQRGKVALYYSREFPSILGIRCRKSETIRQ